MKSLADQVAESFGGGFGLAFPLPPTGEGEQPQTETTGDDNLAVLAFDAGHPLRFPLRLAFSSDPFPARESDGWGPFATEIGRPSIMSALVFISVGGRDGEDPFSSLFGSRTADSTKSGTAESTGDGADAPAAAATGADAEPAEGVEAEAEATSGAAEADTGAASEPGADDETDEEGELVPAYAYAAVERARSGFNVVGFAIVLGKAPEGNFIAQEGETFDATSAPWLRVASNDYMLNTAGPLDQLVRTTVEGLDDPFIYALVPDHYIDTLAGFEAKIVATVEVDDGDGVYSVLKVTLKEEPEAAEEPAGGAALVEEAVAEEAVVEEPAGGAALVEEDGELKAEGDGVVEGEGGVQHVADETLTAELATE